MSTYSVEGRGIWGTSADGRIRILVLVDVQVPPDFFDLITRAVAAQDLLARDPEVLRAAVELAEAEVQREGTRGWGADKHFASLQRYYGALAGYREVRDRG